MKRSLYTTGALFVAAAVSFETHRVLVESLSRNAYDNAKLASADTLLSTLDSPDESFETKHPVLLLCGDENLARTIAATPLLCRNSYEKLARKERYLGRI